MIFHNELKGSKNESIDLSRQLSGLYITQIYFGTQVKTGRLIKQWVKIIRNMTQKAFNLCKSCANQKELQANRNVTL